MAIYRIQQARVCWRDQRPVEISMKIDAMCRPVFSSDEEATGNPFQY
jgi:hypothetical protein